MILQQVILKDCIMRLTDRRRAVAKSLPYDARVEFLRSTPNASIDTGILDIDTFEIKFRMSAFGAFAPIFGNYKSETNNGWRLIMAGEESKQYLIGTFGEKTGVGGNTYVPLAALGVDHTLFVSPSTIIADGVEVSERGTDTGITNTKSIALFTQYVYQVGVPQIYLRIYYFKAWKNNMLVRDFIPVRVGQVGYMYDRVSKELFGNISSGTFILGNDV